MAKNIKAIYDTCAKLVKDAEDQAAKGQEPDKAILDALTTSFSNIIEFEKYYLIQCQDRFYGAILMDLDLTIDYGQRGALDLKVDKSPIVLGINPLFCADYTFPEFTGAVVNEILKLVYLHPATYNELNPEGDPKKHEDLENASSAASTSIVSRDIRLDKDDEYGGKYSNGCRIPNDKYTTANLNSDCSVRSQEDMPLQYYYNILKKFKKKDSNSSGDKNNNGQGQPGNGRGVATRNNNGGKDIHNWEKSDKDEVKSEIKSICSNALNSLSEKSRGLIPAGILEQIQSLLAPPKLNWKDILRKMVGSIPVPYKSTRKRLNRRQPYRSDIPGRLPKRTVNVVCAFDTSGSMSDDDIAYCINEVFNIIKVYEGFKVTIIECDAEIGKIYEAKRPTDVQSKMSGRGGTSYVPVIEYINGTGEFKNNPKYPKAGCYGDALLVYFTDGYGDYEIPKPKTYRNLWVIMEDEKCLSLKEPYGDVKALKKDEDFRKDR